MYTRFLLVIHSVADDQNICISMTSSQTHYRQHIYMMKKDTEELGLLRREAELQRATVENSISNIDWERTAKKRNRDNTERGSKHEDENRRGYPNTWDRTPHTETKVIGGILAFFCLCMENWKKTLQVIINHFAVIYICCALKRRMQKPAPRLAQTVSPKTKNWKRAERLEAMTLQKMR